MGLAMLGNHGIIPVTSERRCDMKIVKAIAILLVGPLLGCIVGCIIAIFLLPPDPNFASNGGHAAPGDGFLVILCVLGSLLISVPLSAVLAAIVLFRKQIQGQLHNAISKQH